jgi:hypothetical protein
MIVNNSGIGCAPDKFGSLPNFPFNYRGQREANMKEYPTQAQIKKVLDYDPITGIFTWKARPVEMFKQGTGQTRAYNTFNSRYAGRPAGRPASNGYLLIRFTSSPVHYLAHRLAWIYVYGAVPSELDHIDKTRTNNAIANLRELGHVDNARNYSISKTNTSGVNGVAYHARYKAWRARIKVDYKSIHLGMFQTIEEAVRARYAAEVKYGFTEFNPNSTAHQYLQEARQ